MDSKYIQQLCDNLAKHIKDESLSRYGNTVPEYMMKSPKVFKGIFFGEKHFRDSNLPHVSYPTIKFSVGKPSDRDGHVLVVGGAGSGKSSCIAIPTLETWDGTIFAIDIKGELTTYWNEKLSKKRPTKVINLTKDNIPEACSYDPFYLLQECGEDELVQNAKEIAQSIIPMPPNVLEPFWIQAAQHVLTAAILYGFGHKVRDDDGNEIDFTFIETMELIQKMPIWELIKEIGESGNENAIMHVNQFIRIENPSDNKMLSGISAELSNKVMVFATDRRVKEVFTPTENFVKWDDLETHNIFLRLAEDKIGQWDGAITLILTQLIRSLERRRDKKHSQEGKSIVLSEHGEVISPTLLLLDEFPRLGKVDVIQNAVSTLRSKGVTICLMMQSLAQLDKTYGKDSRKIIVDNCQYKAILQVTDPENQKIFSDMVGTIKVSTMSVNQSGTDSSGNTEGYSSTYDDSTLSSGKSKGHTIGYTKTLSETREPIIHPHEFATFSKEMVLMTPEGFCRVHKRPYYWPKLVSSSPEK